MLPWSYSYSDAKFWHKLSDHPQERDRRHRLAAKPWLNAEYSPDYPAQLKTTREKVLCDRDLVWDES